MESQTGPLAPRKRQRKAKSCQPCRDRKVRCDQAAPCGPCRRSRDRLTCVYRDDAPAPVAAVAGQPGAPLMLPPGQLSGVPQQPHQLSNSSRFELAAADPGAVSGGWTAMGINAPPPAAAAAAAADIGGGQQYAPGSQPQPYPRDTPSLYQDEAIRKLDERVRRLEQLEARLKSHGLDDSAGTFSTAQPVVPRLRVNQDKARLFPESHWVHTAEKVYALDKSSSFDSDVEPTLGLDKAEWMHAYKELRSLRNSLKTQRWGVIKGPIALSDMHATFPSRDVCDKLVSNYLSTVERLHRILHAPRFLEQYEQFWQDPQSLHKSFFAKLGLVLAIGVPFIASGQDEVDADLTDQLQRGVQQWVYAAQWWLAGPTEKSTHNLNGLQVFCLLLVARRFNGLGPSPTLSASSLLSMAMQMGLHRNIETFPTVSFFQAQSMSRLWATIVELLLASFLESGTPLPVELENFDASAPANIDDSALTDETSPQGPGPGGSGRRTTDMSIPLLLVESQALRIKALKVVNETRLQTPYETIVSLANDVKSACANVSAFFHAHSDELEPGVVFHKNYIDMYLRKHILLLHRPFMLDSQTDPRFHLSRKVCLESCIVMASYADQMKLPSQLDDFANLMVHGSGHLRGALTLDVVLTLGLELKTQLEEGGGPSRDPRHQDPARELALASRAPILRRLEHIREQLSQLLFLGSPSLKRYVMTSALLAQVRAMEAGGNVRGAIYDDIKQSLQNCTEACRARLAQHTPPAATDVNGVTHSFPEEMEFDLGDLDFEAILNPLNLFDPSAFTGISADVGL